MAYAIANVPVDVAAAPAYIASLSPYQVRKLAGSFAPANGKTTMASITPAEWQSDIRYVVAGYSGGGKDCANGKLIVHGGGHGDSANNGVYIFDASGGARPNGWVEPLEISPLANVRNTTGLASGDYSDTLAYTAGAQPYGAHGRFGSVHTIDGGFYASHNDTYYRLGGSPWQGGQTTSTCWAYALATKRLRRLVDSPSDGDRFHSTAYNPTAKKALVVDSSSYTARFLRCDFDTVTGQGANTCWSPGKNINPILFGYYTTGIFNSTTGNAIFVGQGLCREAVIDWSAETVSIVNRSPTGATAPITAQGPMGWYDPVIDRYVLIGGAFLSSWPTLYFMHPTTFAITAVTLTAAALGDLPLVADPAAPQHHSRFAFVSDWRAVIVLGSWDQPPSVIRLPSVAP